MTPMRLDVVEDVLATPVRPVLRVVMLHVSRHEDEYLTVSDRADQIWVSLRTAQLARARGEEPPSTTVKLETRRPWYTRPPPPPPPPPPPCERPMYDDGDTP